MKCKRVQGDDLNVYCAEPAIVIAHYRMGAAFGSAQIDMPLCELHFLEAKPPNYDPIPPDVGTA